MATTDGVGTKLIALAARRPALRRGRDLAAHCVNDVITTGAEPALLPGLRGLGLLDLAEVAELVDGAASVCREAGCAILGGETAELPGIYREGELDFAGTMVGLVRRADLVDGSRCEAGRRRLGLPSSGLHANGFTLVRAPARRRRLRRRPAAPADRLYLEDVRRLRERADVQALAHVTGGGILGNLPASSRRAGARIDWESWERPPVFAWLDERGIPEEEQRRVFNLGIGFCAVVPARTQSAASR